MRRALAFWLLLMCMACAGGEGGLKWHAAPALADCDMRTERQIKYATPRGVITWQWRFNTGPILDCGGPPAPGASFYACSTMKGWDVDSLFIGPVPDFNDLCGLARIGHEVLHGMGADHVH